MDQNCSDSDVSLSPSQILDRLQVLRQMQLLQRGKLQKQRLQYQGSPETSGITETVSHFSNSTSYNTFRNLLQSPQVTSNDSTPRLNTSNLSQQINERDLIDGVSVLNLSRESEYIINSPTSTASRTSAPSRSQVVNGKSPPNKNLTKHVLVNKHISLDEMPILSPKKDFEALVLEKLQCEKKTSAVKTQKKSGFVNINKKPFLRRGEGMSRFGLKKNDLVIQNTKSLPWRRKTFENKSYNSPLRNNSKKTLKNNIEQAQVQILVTETRTSPFSKQQEIRLRTIDQKELPKIAKNNAKACENVSEPFDTSNCEIHSQSKPVNKPEENFVPLPKVKHPLLANKGKTWATIFTKEQDDFLRQLKQSNYYKNFASPAKSTVSDVSTNEVLCKLQQEREIAEQNMFELLETKVSHEGFNLDNSFLNKFLRKSKLECSGESTPLIMQKCVVNNPNLMHIFPDLTHKRRNEHSQSDSETCVSEYTECSDCSTCCSCKTVEETNSAPQSSIKRKQNENYATGHEDKISMVSREEDLTGLENHNCQKDTVTENDMKADMAEMNAKLLATSDLLKDRLHELEDEIETFRKENANLSKMREEIDTERQKFYEDKAAFEQKFNEEKILSEYYLAEEKEKLTKQKQIYEKYVREMRGRLNKKEKDEVINLRKEINDCKEEIRMKDAKSTSTIARLRNQLKIMEKEKKDLQAEVEKLKKENRRIQHSNEVTRRLTNIKYLEEINKKLSNMAAKDTQSEIELDSNIKYKAFEIERQSRNRKIQPVIKNTLRPRAKSVPNLNVTSRYAKYFSQRDAISQMEKNKSVNIEHTYPSYNDDVNDYYRCDDEPNSLDETESIQDKSMNDNEDENNLEKIYKERFHSTSPKSDKCSLINNNDKNLESDNFNGSDFFIRKSNSSSSSARESNSPNRNSEFIHLENLSNSSKSPVSVLSYRSTNTYKSPLEDENLMRTEHKANMSRSSNSINRPKSPVSILSNRSSSSQKSATVINKEHYMDKTMVVSPEPSTSKTSLSRSNLNPIEIKKPDGSKELRFPNGNIKYISADYKYSKFVYYNGDVKENFYNEGRIKYYYAETKTFHTTHPDGLEVLEFSDGQVEKRYKDGSSEIRLPNGSVRYFDPKNTHVREEWRFPDGARLTVNADGEQRIVFANGQVEVHAKDHKRREFPDGTVKLVYNDGTSETRYASGRIRIKDKHGNLIMDSTPG